MSTSSAEHLVKAAKHYEEAANHLRKAAQHEEQRNSEADHLVRLGAAHASHAHEHADKSASEHADGMKAGCCGE